MSPGGLIALAILLPAAGALTAAVAHRHRDLREATTLVIGGALVLVVVRIALTGSASLELVQLMPGIALAFDVEPLGLLFALVASTLWVVTTAYSIGYMRGHDEDHQSRFYACFALSISATMGIAFARNLLTLFVFYELLTLSTYPLVIHHRTEGALRAGRIYLGVLLSTSIGLLLLAVIWTWCYTGTLEFRPGGILDGRVDPRTAAILLGLYAFGIGKAALMPFHRWLPAAMVAPTPVSALLHAVAVVKAGVFSILKVVVYVFGIDFLANAAASVWLMHVAALTIVLASLIALTKDNLKARLAYSTISQLSYIVLGAALANRWGVIGGGMHIATHALGKITLFFCAGAIYIAADKTEISEMRGIGRVMPVTTFAFLLGSLSIIGLPPMGGSWSKWLLMLGSADAQRLSLIAVLMVSSLLNIAYLMPVVIRGFFCAPPGLDGPVKIREAPLFCVVPLCLTAIGCLAIFFYADEIYRLLAPVARP
ncbi:MAG TPA: proton-conducting transporter membrane subunit [Candidatus Polarisedimenticolaceae bacterium]|nr:proton-conducting transporter membrane subunit [Candidatus Polarisedimenticolaceae bacterium]